MFATPPEAGPAAWLDELDPEQRRAATHGSGPLLVLAGAGTGKTTTLSARVAWLVEQGVPSDHILLLTFTRRSAREMLARVRARLGAAGAPRLAVVGGTFHSVAHQVVRLHATALGLPAGFGVIDASDAGDLLDLLREEQGLAASGRRFPRKRTLLDIYSRTVNVQRPLGDVLAESFPWCQEHRDDLAALFRAYGERKRALGLLDLDDLLLSWRALALDATVGPRLGDRFAHLLVDEYQDVNALQVDILRGLRSVRRDITVVGDDHQAVYGFRGASAEHILEFPQAFPGAEVVTLVRNYRSTAPIVAVANQVAAEARRAHPKVLRTARDGARPALRFCRDEGSQAAAVATRVLELHEEGLLLRRQAVLMRAAHHSDLVELELTRRGLPFVKYGGIRYLEAAHIKDFVALLRLADNPVDAVSWFRVLQLLDGVGPVRARGLIELIALAGADGRPPSAAEVAGRWMAAEEAHVPEEARPDGRRLVEALAACAGERHAGVRAERLRDALVPLLEGRYDDAAIRVHDVDQLAEAAGQAGDLGRLVAELVLDPPASSSDLARPPHLDEDYLVLSTVHSAKGLEWEAVHLIGASDGAFPSDMALSTEEGLDEERRLFYVALTRARRTLDVYVPVRYYHRPRGRDDAHGYGMPSRFLTDAVQDACDVTREGPGDAGLPEQPGEEVAASVHVSVDALWE